ncbi:MAG: hypothetical protein J2P50_07920 [Hyphomicrobiaceae bacterium]|nr:hypothetical protein [Hyphomicrobiaceae bacterium]
MLLLAAALLLVPVARGGHEVPVYPSYYPHEIEIAVLEPARAGEMLGTGKLNAYVGRPPSFAAGVPKDVASALSLGSYIVVKLNPNSRLAKEQTSACELVGAVVREAAAIADRRASAGLPAAAAGAGFIVAHPYPVTPLNGDYIIHADLAEAAKARFAGDGAKAPAPMLSLRLRAEGALAEGLVRPEWRAEGADWDALVVQVDAAGLLAAHASVMNGWMGPRWVRSGWFQAYRLLGDLVAEPSERQRVEDNVARLEAGEVADATESANVQRDLVGRLTAGCRGAVVGYTLRQEYYNASFSDGIENITPDAVEGFSSPMFLRTVKLKDFPWNGWLKLGMAAPPRAAWNPIGGFTDEFGRLLWFAVGDTAVMPSPYDHGWVLNRISEVRASSTP